MHEITLLSEFAEKPDGNICGWNAKGLGLIRYDATIMHLLDKRLITLSGTFKDEGFAAYQVTQLGRVVAGIAKSGLPQFMSTKVNQPVTRNEPPKHEDTNPA
jgi:hypothetical protein